MVRAGIEVGSVGDGSLMNMAVVRTFACGVFLLLSEGYARASDMICFEAESAEEVTSPMKVVDATEKTDEKKEKAVDGASSEKYLEITEGASKSPGGTNAQASCTFEVKGSGQYYLWCRVWWLDHCGNSFSMSIDDAKSFTFGQDRTFGSWHWVKAPPRLKQLNLSKGKHTLKIKNREDGVRLDQILFVEDDRYVPVETEDVTVKEGE